MQVAIMEGEFRSEGACKLFEGETGGGVSAVGDFGSEAGGVWPGECQLWLRCERRESQRGVSEWVERQVWSSGRVEGLEAVEPPAVEDGGAEYRLD